MQINEASRQIHLKLVYAGGRSSGKTTNLEYIQTHAEQAREGGIESIRDSRDQTLLFDFAPFACRDVEGFQVHVRVYTLPGSTMIDTPQELGFNGLDGLVLVLDSQWSAFDENIRYFDFLQKAMRGARLDLSVLPHVLQYNKRDAAGVAPVHYLDLVFNKHRAPAFEASSSSGRGVFETLNALARLALNRVVQAVGRSTAVSHPAGA